MSSETTIKQSFPAQLDPASLSQRPEPLRAILTPCATLLQRHYIMIQPYLKQMFTTEWEQRLRKWHTLDVFEDKERIDVRDFWEKQFCEKSYLNGPLRDFFNAQNCMRIMIVGSIFNRAIDNVVREGFEKRLAWRTLPCVSFHDSLEYTPERKELLKKVSLHLTAEDVPTRTRDLTSEDINTQEVVKKISSDVDKRLLAIALEINSFLPKVLAVFSTEYLWGDCFAQVCDLTSLCSTPAFHPVYRTAVLWLDYCHSIQRGIERIVSLANIYGDRAHMRGLAILSLTNKGVELFIQKAMKQSPTREECFESHKAFGCLTNNSWRYCWSEKRWPVRDLPDPHSITTNTTLFDYAFFNHFVLDDGFGFNRFENFRLDRFPPLRTNDLPDFFTAVDNPAEPRIFARADELLEQLEKQAPEKLTHDSWKGCLDQAIKEIGAEVDPEGTA